MSELKHVDSNNFNRLFSLDEREKVKNSKKKILDDISGYNKYFDNVSSYKPYSIFCGEILDIPKLNDISKPNICGLDFLSKLQGDHIVLDYACGIGSFLYYSNKFFTTYGYDNWNQISKMSSINHLEDLNISSDSLIDYKDIEKIKPTIINVAGYWIEDIELYKLDSVQYILSDPLYNSGRINGEGIYLYKKSWDNFPEKFNYKKIISYPALDIYAKCNSK